MPTDLFPWFHSKEKLGECWGLPVAFGRRHIEWQRKRIWDFMIALERTQHYQAEKRFGPVALVITLALSHSCFSHERSDAKEGSRSYIRHFFCFGALRVIVQNANVRSFEFNWMKIYGNEAFAAAYGSSFIRLSAKRKLFKLREMMRLSATAHHQWTRLCPEMRRVL